MSGEQVRALSEAELAELTLVKAHLSQTQSKLSGYQQSLQLSYNNQLRLHCYTVVAIGYERFVWAEI